MRIKKIKNNECYPCKKVKDENIKCMCKEFREQIERKELGKCPCGLYEIIEE